MWTLQGKISMGEAKRDMEASSRENDGNQWSDMGDGQEDNESLIRV